MRRAGLGSLALTESPPPLLSDPAELSRWLADSDVDVLLGALVDEASGALAPESLGAIYEELLQLGIRRLDAGSICVRPSEVWVSARAVLSERPETRSKWLQRAASLPKSAVQQLAASLAAATTHDAVLAALAPLRASGTELGAAGQLVVDASVARRRSGSHYTRVELSRAVVARTLLPLVEGAASATIRSLRVCDPAMGSGAFLEQAARFLSEHLLAAWRLEGALEAALPTADAAQEALRIVIADCLYGVDKDPVAADLARACLASLGSSPEGEPPNLSSHLRTGDALVGRARPREAARLFEERGFHWHLEFPDVLDGSGSGFHACIGNPPWVAYVGRATQPLDPALARYYEAENPAFHGYRTLHGLFVRRAAELLRPGGRLGLVLPTSVADLAGYAPTRGAHDELCDVDPALIDFGDGAFEGVFQPCMGLTSTRRPHIGSCKGAEWPLARSDLDAVAQRLLDRLEALPKLSSDLFGERGFQTTGNDHSHLRRLAEPEGPFVVPIREGTDVGEFALRAPRTFLDPRGLRGRFRPAADWQRVPVLIRQTARYPIAALSDGAAFRNSILAGFTTDDWPAPALVAYLNSNAIRWYHYS